MQKEQTEHLIVANNGVNSNERVILKAIRKLDAGEVKFRFVLDEPFQSIVSEKSKSERSFAITQSLSKGVRWYIKFHSSESTWKFTSGRLVVTYAEEKTRKERIECSGVIVHGMKILDEIYDSL